MGELIGVGAATMLMGVVTVVAVLALRKEREYLESMERQMEERKLREAKDAEHLRKLLDEVVGLEETKSEADLLEELWKRS